MERMVFLFESTTGHERALTTDPEGKDLRRDRRWRRGKEFRLNRPKLADAGVTKVEDALAVLAKGDPYVYTLTAAIAR